MISYDHQMFIHHKKSLVDKMGVTGNMFLVKPV